MNGTSVPSSLICGHLETSAGAGGPGWRGHRWIGGMGRVEDTHVFPLFFLPPWYWEASSSEAWVVLELPLFLPGELASPEVLASGPETQTVRGLRESCLTQSGPDT